MSSGKRKPTRAEPTGSPGSQAPAPAAAPRRVPCPTCRQPALFSAANPWRPFCGSRCHGIDLGAWAHEDYRVDADPAPPGSDDIPESN